LIVQSLHLRPWEVALCVGALDQCERDLRDGHVAATRLAKEGAVSDQTTLLEIADDMAALRQKLIERGYSD
jgi:hypothetical protein